MSRIVKTIAWLGEGDGAAYSVHFSLDSSRPSMGVILCPPIGIEYSHHHRLLTQTAENFASTGECQCIKLDYTATGDSPGDVISGNLLQSWHNNIALAASHLISERGATSLLLWGFRSGALIAASAVAELAARYPLKKLILWNPVLSGKALLRDAEIFARNQDAENSRFFDFGGLVTTKNSAQELGALKLTEFRYEGLRSICLLQPENERPVKRLREYLEGADVQLVQYQYGGQSEMMKPALLNIVSQEAIDKQCEYLCITESKRKKWATSISESSRPLITTNYCEKIIACSNRQAVGVLAMPASAVDVKIIIVLPNGGASPKSGPARLYVHIARTLAKAGMGSLRIDLSQLGDGAMVTDKAEKAISPYPDNSSKDIQKMLSKINQLMPNRKIILGGLCSGGHNAFHYLLNDKSHTVNELIFINPIDFYWKPGMSVTPHVEPIYNRKATDRMELAARLINTISWGFGKKLATKAARYCLIRDKYLVQVNPQLSIDFLGLVKEGVAIKFFVSKNEPGESILKASLGAVYSFLRREDKLFITNLPATGHAFLLWDSQVLLADALISSYKKTLDGA